MRGDRLAADADLGRAPPRPAARRRARPRRRAEHALADVLQRAARRRRRARRREGRHARRPARGHPAHPPGPGHRHGHRPGGGAVARPRAVPLRGADGHRRRPPGGLLPHRHPRDLGVGRGAALRRPAAVPQGRAGPAAPRRGPARHPDPLGELPEEARAWERGVDELSAEDDEIADYVRSLEESRDTTELPEASGEAIALEFERYLRRRGDDPDTRPGSASARSRCRAGRRRCG